MEQDTKQKLTLLLEVDREKIGPGAVENIISALAGVEVLEFHFEDVLAEDRTRLDEQQREILARDTGDVGLPNVERLGGTDDESFFVDRSDEP